MKSWVAVGVGACLVAVGFLFIQSHRAAWRSEQADGTLDDQDRAHYHARYRRRMQTSGMLVLLGILIPLWDWFLDLRWVMAATLIGFLVFALVGWVVLMAFGDMISTRTHSHLILTKVRQKQAELERQANKLRAQSGNGHSPRDSKSY